MLFFLPNFKVLKEIGIEVCSYEIVRYQSFCSDSLEKKHHYQSEMCNTHRGKP